MDEKNGIVPACDGTWGPMNADWNAPYLCNKCGRIIDDLQHSHIGGDLYHWTPKQCEQLDMQDYE